MGIELAPQNKRGLNLDSPLIAGSGSVGYADCWSPELSADLFGAVITSPLTMRPHKGVSQVRIAEIPAGFLFSTGDHNPGFRRVLQRQTSLWRRLQTPLILPLVEGSPGDRVWMAERLDDADVGVDAIVLPMPEDVNLGEASASISAVRHVTTLPILVKLPATRAAHLAKSCIVAGADALVVGTSPPVVYPTDEDVLLEAPLAGPVAFPFTLRALRRVVALNLGVPLIACGGIHSLDDVALCLDEGADAVQIRSLIWTDPAAARQLAFGVRTLTAAAGEAP